MYLDSDILWITGTWQHLHCDCFQIAKKCKIGRSIIRDYNQYKSPLYPHLMCVRCFNIHSIHINSRSSPSQVETEWYYSATEKCNRAFEMQGITASHARYVTHDSLS